MVYAHFWHWAHCYRIGRWYAMVVAKEREKERGEEDWEDDETLDKWKDYPYDELDSRDE